ncbi:uncharacterized protein [Palaemon carinicauda]|uniref:uncharacterized protein n=1 Tax=Palaemon carinicauda TaxID=392227 RepID=UPI0035B6891A
MKFLHWILTVGFFSLVFRPAYTSHFRGAIIMMKPTDSGFEREMEISFQIAWRRDSFYIMCDEDAIQSNTLLGGEENTELGCEEGCENYYTGLSLDFYCSDFSLEENWSFGGRTMKMNFTGSGNRGVLVFTGGNWIVAGSWYLVASNSLLKRNDTGKINSTPRAITAPVIKIKENCNHTISIPVSDPDGDEVRCRWAQGYEECGDACEAFSNAVLDNDTCVITYEAKFGSGIHIAALMIEDFISDSDAPLSSISLQFVVEVYPSDQSCYDSPHFIHPTFLSGFCVAVPEGTIFSSRLISKSGRKDANITEIQTVSPLGFTKSPIYYSSDLDAFYVNISWSPSEEQMNQTHSFCFTSINSYGDTSIQNCIKLITGTKQPTIISVNINHDSFDTYEIIIEFDQSIQYPATKGQINFKDYETDSTLLYIIITESKEVSLIQPHKLIIKPQFEFPENRKVFLELERSIVVSPVGCNPGNEEVRDKNVINFITRDITPPVVTFTDAPSRGRGNFTFRWTTDEPARSICSLDNKKSIDCSSGLFKVENLMEGTHILFIELIDNYNNSANTSHTFYVDLTSPNVTFERVPTTVSNETSSVFVFSCNEFDNDCIFYCDFHNNLTQITNFSLCDGNSFSTPPLENEGEYELSVYAIDSVGNVGESSTYCWEVDLMPPVLLANDSSIECSFYLEDTIGTAYVLDNMDPHPIISFTDNNDPCIITRTWKATDHAGNSVMLKQKLTLLFNLSLLMLPTISAFCSNTSDGKEFVPINTATANNPCKRPLDLSYTDHSEVSVCPGYINRTWVLNDTCTGLQIQQEQIINVYSTCPSDACGQNYSQPHGFCFQGKCLCNHPWRGDSCTILISEPIFKPIEVRSLLEYQDYEANLTLLQGTEPVILSLVSAPERTQLELSTRRLILTKAPAGNLTFTVSATNKAGVDEIIVNAVINATYSPILNPLSKIQFLKGEPIVISGSVSYNGESPIRDVLNGHVPVVIDVENLSFSKIRRLEIFTDQNGKFSFPYSPGSLVYGKFEASARHPSEPKKAPQIQWEIPGMSILKESVLLYDDTIGPYRKSFSNVTVLYNDGGSDLHQIQGKLAQTENTLSDFNVSVTFGSYEKIVNTFEYGNQVALNIDLSTSGPIHLKFPIVVESQEGVSLLVNVEVNIRQVLPVFHIDPPNLETAITRGSQKMIEFKVTNLGKTSAESVRVIVPDSPYFTVSDFSVKENSNDIINLDSQETAKASVLITIPEDKAPGMVSGNFLIESISISKEVPFSILITSDSYMNLTIVVEDEYTYFAEGSPLVSSATVILTNNRLKFEFEGSTSENNGSVTFFNVQEEIYEIYVEAPDHRGRREIVLPSAGNPTINIFIEREAVKIKWSVIQIGVEDFYDITLEADYKVNVPMPVLGISPNMIDLEDYKLGLKDIIEFNVTNYGLIRADNVQLILPSEHSHLIFEFLSEVPESIEAKQSVIIEVEVRHRQTKKRALMCAVGILLRYVFVCNVPQTRSAPVVLIEKDPFQCDIPVDVKVPPLVPFSGIDIDGGEGGRGKTDFVEYTLSFDLQNFCDKCLQAFVDCIDIRKIFKKIFKKIPKKPDRPRPNVGLPFINFPTNGSDLIDNPLKALNFVRILDPDSIFWELVEVIFEVVVVKRISCIYNILKECLWNTFKLNRDKSTKNVKMEAAQDVVIEKIENFAMSFAGIISSIHILKEIFGNEIWLQNGNSSWVNNIVMPVFKDSSELGIFVSSQELQAIKDNTYPDGISWEDKELLVKRLNTTLANWETGNLEPFDGNENMISYSYIGEHQHNITIIGELTKERGFSSYVEAFEYDYDVLSQIEDIQAEEGVCAVIRLQIKQTATLVREGFSATLEIENKEKGSMENIKVEIIIYSKETFEVATKKFAIGSSSLSGSLSETNGNGTLPADSIGASKWLIIPYPEAAPTKVEIYDIGGKLSYTSNGNQVEIPFLPTPVTVHPDPSLVVHYFWEKNVISDDPFTDEVEPAEPFSLGVMIKNEGFGTANSMKMTSSQPKIIENEKGLLISFKMISSMLGSEKIEPSLTVNFGNILPNETKTARWWMTSSLIGKFIDYNATFENRNPLGDPKLSLIEKLDIHELIQNILIPGDGDDGILDFLVNDDEDIYSYPDRIYDSKDMSWMPVQVGNVTGFSYQEVNQAISLKVDTEVALSGWNYFMVEESILDYLPPGKSMKLSKQNNVLQMSDTVLLPKENAWISVDVVSKKRKRYLHILDYSDSTSSKVSYFIDICDNCVVNNITVAPTTSVPQSSIACNENLSRERMRRMISNKIRICIKPNV